MTKSELHNATRRLAAKIAVAAVAVTALSGALTNSADAYTPTSSGSAGYVSAPFTDGVWQSGSAWITAGARVVGESPAYANYDQWVCQTTSLWAINGGRWQRVAADRRCDWIPAAKVSVTFPRIPFSSLRMGALYSVSVDISWQFSNGNVIALKQLDYDVVGDYQCLTGNCYRGTARGLGAYVMFDNPF